MYPICLGLIPVVQILRRYCYADKRECILRSIGSTYFSVFEYGMTPHICVFGST